MRLVVSFTVAALLLSWPIQQKVWETQGEPQAKSLNSDFPSE